MYPSSVQHPSTGFDELSAHSMMNRQPYWLVTSRVDYCNLLLAAAPKSVTDKLQQQWVMNAAVRVVSGTKKYAHPRLDTPASYWATLVQCGRSSHIPACGDGVQVFVWPGIGLPVLSCVQYINHSSCWTTASSFHQLLSTCYSKVSAGPTTWNSFHDNLHEPDMHIDCFPL